MEEYCERKKRAPLALAYNALVQSWPEIVRLAREGAGVPPTKAPCSEKNDDGDDRWA